MFDAMVVNTPHDLAVFACVFVCGQCIGLVFDVFRAIRKAFVPGRRMLAVQDTAFCAVVFFMFSLTVNRVNSGDLRWFVFAGVILGVVLYFLTESRFVLKVLTAVTLFSAKIISKLSAAGKAFGTLVLKPFLKLKKVFERLFGRILPFFRQIFQKTTGKKP